MDNEAEPYLAWGALGTLMRKDKRFTIAVYLSLGLLFASLFLGGGTGIFGWLAYVSLAVLIAIGVGGEIVTIRSRTMARKDKRFTIFVDLNFVGILLFTFLYSFTKLDFFRWLIYMLAILIVIGIGSKKMNLRNRF